MRSDHLSKHLKTHQAKKINAQQQSDAETASTGTITATTPNEMTAIESEQDLAINEATPSEGQQEMVIQGSQI
jgi:hypothetical protein